MLEMRPNCERCDADLAPDVEGASICSFECTFCSESAQHFAGVCPNCGGVLVSRPLRPAALLERFPAAKERTLKPHD